MLRLTLLWYKPCCFSNATYCVIMLTRYWSLSQHGHFQPHSKSKAWPLSVQQKNIQLLKMCFYVTEWYSWCHVLCKLAHVILTSYKLTGNVWVRRISNWSDINAFCVIYALFFFILEGGIQAPTGAPTYQAAPRDGSPVMVPQGYMGHLVMVPAENMQKMSHTSGTAQMYVPVPSQMPYQTTPSSSPLLIGDL